MKPILKWPGGKTQLLEELKKYITPELLKGKAVLIFFSSEIRYVRDSQKTYPTEINASITA